METLILDAVTKSITVVLSGAKTAVDCDVVASWADDTGTAFTEGSSDTTTNGVTPVTVVASPAAGTRRVIKTISIYNADSAPVTVSVNYVSATGTRLLAKVTLAVKDTWTTDGTYDLTGALKTVLAGISGTGTVTGIIIASANGLAGTSNGNAATPTLTLSTSVTGILKGNGTAISAATPGTDYLTSANFVDNEVVSGSVTTYTLANTPVAGTVHLYGRGVRLTPTVDYTISTATITTVNTYAAGDIISDYRK